MKFPPVAEQLAVLKRGTVDLKNESELVERLQQSLDAGRPLRVKLGIDPSSPDIHLGHTVVLRKLRDFQRLGHQVIVLWGTATAMVGDPTGRNKTRPPLTRDQVEHNKRTYREQVARVLDVAAAEERENGEWFQRMSFMDCVALAGRYTVARLLERDDFQKRYREQQPISVHEFLYPLLQGHDSVELRADVELGGTDQLFNLMVGRELQKQAGQPSQVCITVPLLEGLDGVQKMSKSLGNYVGIAESASVQFQKLMDLRGGDDHGILRKYFELLTDVPADEVAGLVQRSPLDAKFRLAHEIVAGYHGADAARAARAEYDRVHRDGGLPDHVETWTAPADLRRDAAGSVPLPAAVAASGLAASTSEARRLIQGGGVRVDDEVCRDVQRGLAPGSYLVRVGKKVRRCAIGPAAS